MRKPGRCIQAILMGLIFLEVDAAAQEASTPKLADGDERELDSILKRLKDQDIGVREKAEEALAAFIVNDARAARVDALCREFDLDCKERVKRVTRGFRVKKQGRIAFGGPDKITLINADGGDMKAISTGIPDGGNGMSRLSWSPDARKIAFQTGDLYVVDVAEEKTANLTTGTKISGKLSYYGFAEPLKPSWSPDGKKLLVEADGLHVVDVEGRGVTRLEESVTWHSGWGPRSPQWSPDGKRVLFMGYSRRNRYDLCVYEMEKGQTTNLTFDHATIDDSHRYQASWSPDGSEIVFVGRGDGHFGLCVISADGKKARNLTERTKGDGKGSEQQPMWSPDGRRIVFRGRRPEASLLSFRHRSGRQEREAPARGNG